MEELVEFIAKALVSEPEEVSVHQGSKNTIELTVGDEDRGRIIGRKGRTAHAIRTLMGAASADGKAPHLEILD